MGSSKPTISTPSKIRQRILFLDAYDSFTNNITALLTTLLDVDVFVLPIHSPLLDPSSPTFEYDFGRELAHYSAVVCGPGPGSPLRNTDVGLMNSLWTLAEEHMVPTLGICLGFQSLVVAAGGRVRRLRKGLHGMVRRIDHGGTDLFTGVSEFRATLYHSLGGDLGQDAISDSDWTEHMWKPLPGFDDLLPLAWVEEIRDGVGDGEESVVERVLMAVKHRAKPFWGLQYHPESVCTETEGNKVVINWFKEALRWNDENKRVPIHGDTILAGKSTRPSLLSQLPQRGYDRRANEESQPNSWHEYGVGYKYSSRTLALPSNMSITDIVESLDQVTGKEQIVLDSANASTGGAADIRGRYSIVALDVQNSLRLQYHAGDPHVKALLPPDMQQTTGACSPPRQVLIPLDDYANIWLFLAHFHDARKPKGTTVSPAEEIPFLGGFMGYITYEQGLSDINVKFRLEDRGHHRPDVCFAWVTKSVVVDHAKRTIHIQHLHAPETRGQDWLDRTTEMLRRSSKRHDTTMPQSKRDPRLDLAPSLFGVTSSSKPTEVAYEQKVKACQEYIAAGESYELCLTDQTLIRRSAAPESASQPLGDIADNIGMRIAGTMKRRRRSSVRNGAGSAWQLFRTLRSRQPAPFASYIRLGGATLVSSSPERFLQYDMAGLCSMRPMKGTVKKSSACATLAEAEMILHVPKEEAENLMIVDLVRHDLHGVCGAGNVSCRDLMRVEEYRSVFQMTTVVEGRLPSVEDDEDGDGGGSRITTTTIRKYTGLDVLAASLPPGSMTGAPKKRSCEILQEIEGHKERSLYSGVVGYMCVSGMGDWSVTIRSMFRWDDEVARDQNGTILDGQDVWRIGAGGAVTILSTPRGESEEMFTKLAGPMGIFSSPD